MSEAATLGAFFGGFVLLKCLYASFLQLLDMEFTFWGNRDSFVPLDLPYRIDHINKKYTIKISNQIEGTT